MLWAAVGVLIGWIGRERRHGPAGRVAPLTCEAPVDRASPASHAGAHGVGEAATGSSTPLERRVVAAQMAAVLGLAATILLPQPLRPWTAVAITVLWALAGLAFAAGLGRRMIARVGCARARARPPARFRTCRRRVAAWWRSVPHVVALTPATWPFLMLSGPVTAAFALKLMPADIAVGLYAGSVATALPIQLIVSSREVLRELNALVSLGGLAVSIVMWIAVAAVVAYEFGWPAPDDTGYFATAAQINATLLIAGVINAAPAAWRITPRIHLTWILTAPTVAVVGLGASIAGAISTRGSEFLFILSISALAPIVVAVMLGAYDYVTRRHDTSCRRGTRSGGQAGRAR